MNSDFLESIKKEYNENPYFKVKLDLYIQKLSSGRPL